MGAGVEGAVDAADGADADLLGLGLWEWDLAEGVPGVTVGGAEGADAVSAALDAEGEALGGEASAAEDVMLVFDAAAEGDLVWAADATIQAEEVPRVLPEQDAAESGALFRSGGAGCLEDKLSFHRSEKAGGRAIMSEKVASVRRADDQPTVH